MNLLICFGTRPEYIKIQSLVKNLDADYFQLYTCFTGQQPDLVREIAVDYHLEINTQPLQTSLTTADVDTNRLNSLFISIMNHPYIFQKVDYVLVQGDTTSACAMALSAFHHKRRVIHLEAGLRSGDSLNPFPEEMNRQLIARLSQIHLCPTNTNQNNLLKEGIDRSKIFVVGNTGLDGLNRSGLSYRPKVLVTIHRRDNLPIIKEWFQTIETLAKSYPSFEFLLPIHPNPEIELHRNIFQQVRVTYPLDHEQLVNYLKQCRLIISDSGGLQEEASFFQKKIIVCRKTTERPETLGTNSFLCPHPNQLKQLFEKIIDNYRTSASCPYGDGQSWKAVEDVLKSIST